MNWTRSLVPAATAALFVALSGPPAHAQHRKPPEAPSRADMIAEWERAQIWELDTTGAPNLGPADAPIKVVEFVDYLCGTCRQVSKAWEGYLPTTNNNVVIIHKNYPLDNTCNSNIQRPVHVGACWLALGAVCAAQEGQFDAYSKAAFSAPLQMAEAKDALDIAAGAGLDRAAMESCINSADAMTKLKAQIAEAISTGIRGTPQLFINGKKLPGLPYFATWIEAEAEKLGLKVAGPS